MKDISYKRLVMFGLIAALGLGLMPQNASAAPQFAQNLLTNSDFEGSFVRSDSKTSVGQGWTAWWIPRPAGQPDWSYNQPDFIASAPCGSVCDHRIHTGGNAQRIFQYFGTYVAGVYQRVSVPQDADLRVTAFGQGWSSTTEQPQNVSNGGTHMHMKIGVDPQGGTNPLDPRVVWSGESDALDSWQQFQVFAHAQGTQVTVFLYAAPEDARRKNEVYWDDTDLEALSGDLAATAQASYPTPTSAPAVYTPTPISTALGQNLLTDGGFEGPLYIPCSRYDTVPWQHIQCDGLDFKERTKDGQRVNIMWNTVQVPLGWEAWWLAPNTNHADPNFYQNHPNNCYEDAPVDCVAWHNPEFRDTEKIVSGPPRIHSGQNSVKYFTFWSVHEAGLLQTVAVPPGSTVRFSAYMQAWSSNQDGREEFPNSYLSSGQTSMHMKVGIDPNGGEDPWSPNVVWSPEHDSYDQFGYYEVRTVAQGDKVTVFTHSMPEKGLKHNDMYVDDAELVLIDAGSAATSSSAQQPAAQAAQPAQQMPPAVVNAAPPPTALPRPDGAIVHVVTSGDTVFGLALQYKVPMEQILQLNGLTKDSLIHIGQELVIAAPPQAAAAPAPQNTATPPADKASAAPPQVAIAKTSGKTLLCVRAYNDANADGLYSPGELLVKGTVFAVSDQTGKSIVSYTSDGLSEPHCFSRLTPGTYIVSINPVPGATITSDREWSVQLDQGATVEVSFGSRLSSDALNQSSSSPDGGGLILFLVLIAAGVAGWAIYRRRSTSTGGLM